MEASLVAFRRILRALRLASHETQRIAGISAAQLFVLRTLESGSEFSVAQIAASTMTDRTSAAAVVERLLDAGLVSRQPSDEDKRRAAITITRSGRAVLKRAPEPPTALLVAGLESLTEPQRSRLADGLSLLASSMGLSAHPAPMLFEDETKATPRRRASAKRIRP